MSKGNSFFALCMGSVLLVCAFFACLTVGATAPAPDAPPLPGWAIVSPGVQDFFGGNNGETNDEEPALREAVIITAGDIMVHQPQYVQACDVSSKCYDFFPSFEQVAPYLQASDLAVGNLETTFGGEKRGYSGYPCFNSPDELAGALQQAGFDLLCTANNHSMDSGERGVYRTRKVIKESGMGAFGTASSAEERDQPLLVNVNDITLAFLAYTYGTNGIPLPSGRDYIINLIKKDRISADIERARHDGAELIIIYIHWGCEYQMEPNREQRELAQFLADAGADIIIGGHPHVIQSMEYISREEEHGCSSRVFVAYSLGNFISNQHKIPGAVPTNEVEYGLVLRLHLTREQPDQAACLQEVDYLLTWVDRARRHRIIPLPSVISELPAPSLIPEEKWPEIRNTALHLQERLTGFSPGEFLPILQKLEQHYN